MWQLLLIAAAASLDLITCDHYLKTKTKYTPVVIWHGLGDSATSKGIQQLIDAITEAFSGIYVKSLHAKDVLSIERLMGIVIQSEIQLETAIQTIKNDPELQDGFIGVGLSQGGLFLRAIAQRLASPRTKVLITLGSPHQGQFGVGPLCYGNMGPYCQYVSRSVTPIFYKPWAQKTLVISNYWHDPFNLEAYIAYCSLLPKLNHEIVENEDEKTNFMNLEKLVLVKFEDDVTLSPSESAWFGFYEPNSVNITGYNNTDFFKKNKLGFKDMVNENKVDFVELPGGHLQFSEEWLVELLGKYVDTV